MHIIFNLHYFSSIFISFLVNKHTFCMAIVFNQVSILFLLTGAFLTLTSLEPLPGSEPPHLPPGHLVAVPSGTLFFPLTSVPRFKASPPRCPSVFQNPFQHPTPYRTMPLFLHGLIWPPLASLASFLIYFLCCDPSHPIRVRQPLSSMPFWKVLAFLCLPAWGINKPPSAPALSEQKLFVPTENLHFAVFLQKVFYHKQRPLKTLSYNLF